MLPAFSIIYLFAVVVVGCENSSLQQNMHDMNVLMAFLTLAFLAMTIFKRKDKKGSGVSTLSASLILFLLYSVISFYLSFNEDLSMYPALKMLSALLLAIALIYYLKDIESLNRTLLMVFAFGGILAITGIVEQFFPIIISSKQTSLLLSRSIFTNPNFYAGYLLIHIPIGMYLYFQASSSFAKTLLGHAWILILVALGFSSSLSGQLIAGLQVIVTIIYLLVAKKTYQAKLVGFGVLASILIYFALIKLILEPTLIIPIEEIEELDVVNNWLNSSVGLRLMYWLAAWRIFTEHWLYGSGLWTFTELYPQTGLLSRFPPHAHSMYLQTAAETGLIGLGFLMACLTVLFSTMIRIFKKGSVEVVKINFYIAASLIGFLINNIVEYNWLTSNFIYYFVFLIISVEVLNRETQGYRKWGIKINTQGLQTKVVPIFMVLGAFVVVQYYSYQRIISYDIPMSATMEEMFANTTKAKELCHRCGRPYYLSGIAHLEMYRLSQNSENLVLAEHDLNEVLHRNPYSLGTYLILGKTKSLQGNYSEAKEYYIKAMKDSRHVISAITEIKKIEKNIEGIKP